MAEYVPPNMTQTVVEMMISTTLGHLHNRLGHPLSRVNRYPVLDACLQPSPTRALAVVSFSVGRIHLLLACSRIRHRHLDHTILTPQ